MILPTRTRRASGYDPTTMFNRGLVAQTGYIPDGMQLFQDTWPLKIQDAKRVMTEGISGKEVPIYRVTGLFQLADDTNANARVYSRNILTEAVGAIQEDIDTRSVMGEFDHPPDAKIHLDRISHLITRIWMEGKSVYGEAEILDNLPYGEQLKNLMDRKVQVGISSRGIGDMELRELNGQELYYVTEGYRFVTWDVVAEPSVTGAILHLTEGKLKPTIKRPQPIVRPQQPQRTGVLSRNAYESMLVKEVDNLFSQ